MPQGEVAVVAIVVVVALIVGPLMALRAVSRRQLAAGQAAELRPRLTALLPQLATLPAELQERHWQRTLAFMTRKRFVGCGGLVVSDEMRLTIAGMACLLVLRPESRLFPAVRSVLLYPEAFLVPMSEPDEDGLVDDEPQERIGESWQGDRVILSWADVQAALEGDEVNVVVHEFAHQLDDEVPSTEGAPDLPDTTRWAQVMQREYSRLQRHRRPPVLDPYGAESPAEFFGVVTEAFIQRGAELAKHHGELYELLRDYFGFETREWIFANPVGAGHARD